MTGMSANQTALLGRARKFFQARQYFHARLACEQLLKENPASVDALDLLAEIAMERGEAAEGIAALEKAASLQPKAARFKFGLGRLLIANGRFADAAKKIQQGLKLEPQSRFGLTLLAEVHERQGDLDAARALLQPFIESGTDDAIMGSTWAVLEMRANRPREAIDSMLRHIKRGPVPQLMLFTLGKAYEKVGDVDNAFRVYEAANRAMGAGFNLPFYIEYIDRLIRVFTPATLGSVPKSRNNSPLPILIAGRPRSGTTLVERIVNAHPRVHSVGTDQLLSRLAENAAFEVGSNLQYPDCIADFDQSDVDRLGKAYLDARTAQAAKSSRVVDKMMGMHFHLGFASLIIPGAHAIWVRRNPVDNCFACFTERFGGSNHMYAQDLRDSAITYRYYEKIMRHWQSVLALPILEVHYEELVEDQEGVSRRMIEFCGLEWDEACLNFHDASSTANRSHARDSHSYDQVRKPIYKTSVGRAERFRKHLQPLIDALDEGERMTRGEIPPPVRQATPEPTSTT